MMTEPQRFAELVKDVLHGMPEERLKYLAEIVRRRGITDWSDLREHLTTFEVMKLREHRNKIARPFEKQGEPKRLLRD